MAWFVLLGVLWVLIQIGGVVALVWLSWRYFDQRYKGNSTVRQVDLLSGDWEPTQEVFIDPKDHLKYRVYYNRHTGERDYVREQ